jgi:hypothetical protein
VPEYRLHHDSIRAHVAEAIGTDALAAHHLALAERLASWPAPAEATARRYALHHALVHRAEAGAWGDAWQVAADMAFLEAKCRELGAHDAEADVARTAAWCRASGDEAHGERLTDLEKRWAANHTGCERRPRRPRRWCGTGCAGMAGRQATSTRSFGCRWLRICCGCAMRRRGRARAGARPGRILRSRIRGGRTRRHGGVRADGARALRVRGAAPGLPSARPRERAVDGVFANASLFHVPRQELLRVLGKLWALKPGGALFSSNPRGEPRGVVRRSVRLLPGPRRVAALHDGYRVRRARALLPSAQATAPSPAMACVGVAQAHAIAGKASSAG